MSNLQDAVASLTELQAGMERMQAFVEEAVYADTATFQPLVDKARSWIAEVRLLRAAHTTLVQRARGEDVATQLDRLWEQAGHLKDGFSDYFREFEGLVEDINTEAQSLEEKLRGQGRGAEDGAGTLRPAGPETGASPW